jgi:triphosphoribosyl-dephospho-CoA synthase
MTTGHEALRYSGDWLGLTSPSFAASIAALAEYCLIHEVETWPKPGLVSHVDSGSHHDMDAQTFRRSAAAIRPYLGQLVEAGAKTQGMAPLRKIGLHAEHAMLAATQGINTHRGAIFGMGLLCAAAGWRRARRADMPLGQIVMQRWGADILGGPRLADSHGETAVRRYGAGGARHEAAEGFPSVYQIGLPALREGGQLAPGDAEAARVHACFALIAKLEDTNLLHRGGTQGLRFAQRQAQAFLERGGVGDADWRTTAAMAHRAFVARHLSPGGAADLLAMSLFVQALEHRNV